MYNHFDELILGVYVACCKPHYHDIPKEEFLRRYIDDKDQAKIKYRDKAD